MTLVLGIPPGRDPVTDDIAHGAAFGQRAPDTDRPGDNPTGKWLRLPQGTGAAATDDHCGDCTPRRATDQAASYPVVTQDTAV